MARSNLRPLGEAFTLPTRCRALLQHLAAQPQPFVLNDATLPAGGTRAWSDAIQLLCSRDALQWVGWGGAPRFRVRDDVRRALQGYAHEARLQ